MASLHYFQFFLQFAEITFLTQFYYFSTFKILTANLNRKVLRLLNKHSFMKVS